ncbi:hypothetical protein GLOTRDRAFT_111478 [Gloeophyllum trabeum ATCC 11539]|uniref:Uncharacterized protein n=1 Tax=Gloeophyllum trabeum (strain ATCC 11539 / FP-39264 / Madison 617) TaxID=670483 RepID=S7Q1Q0_GLOTA|nr:uncharacterized protein GLOTRDRAFT_111478 [Gloeophyllum trabeum ATCC 11539]EPQ53906.1 hypothetical protein GLOTRDRAFT_111478 [Gloeophyllum trabeum ATCC 11539]
MKHAFGKRHYTAYTYISSKNSSEAKPRKLSDQATGSINVNLRKSIHHVEPGGGSDSEGTRGFSP